MDAHRLKRNQSIIFYAYNLSGGQLQAYRSVVMKAQPNQERSGQNRGDKVT